jgi:hypothetical protein
MNPGNSKILYVFAGENDKREILNAKKTSYLITAILINISKKESDTVCRVKWR